MNNALLIFFLIVATDDGKADISPRVIRLDPTQTDQGEQQKFKFPAQRRPNKQGRFEEVSVKLLAEVGKLPAATKTAGAPQ